MYLLYRLQPRAETTDTVLLAISESYEALQEYMLSMFDELVDREIEWVETECNLHDEQIDMDNLIKWCINRMKEYEIIFVPYMER